MNITSIKNKAYRLTNTDSSTFLDGVAATILEELNIQYGQRVLDILKVRVDRNANETMARGDNKSVVGLTEGDLGYNGEYPFPTNFLKPVRVEVSYDGISWRPVKFYDVYESPYSEFVDVNDGFSTSEPFVRFDQDSFFVRPVNKGNTINGGILIWYEMRQTDLTETTPPDLEDFGGYLLMEDDSYLLQETEDKILLESNRWREIEHPLAVAKTYNVPTFEKNLHDILAYDLAYQEILMHNFKYDNRFTNNFVNAWKLVEQRFFDFYKSRFKKNIRMKLNQSNYQ